MKEINYTMEIVIILSQVIKTFNRNFLQHYRKCKNPKDYKYHVNINLLPYWLLQKV